MQEARQLPKQVEIQVRRLTVEEELYEIRCKGWREEDEINLNFARQEEARKKEIEAVEARNKLNYPTLAQMMGDLKRDFP